MTVLGLVYSNDILLTGTLQGLCYSLVAFGLVLIFRATGVINFAHGQIGAFGGYVMALLFIRYDLPYVVSLPVALAAGVALGVAAELILRRLFTQPRLLLFVATIGLTQVIQFVQLRLPIPEEQQTSAPYPVLIDANWNLGGLHISGHEATVLAAVPIIMIGLIVLLQRSRFGMRVRATADNLPAAQLAGIDVRGVSTLVWAIAGFLAVLSGLLIAPLQGSNIAVVQSALGPKLLLLSLTAAMVGRMRSFGWTAVGGIAVGVIDWFLVTWSQTGDVAQGSNIAVVFVLLLLLLLTIGRSAVKDDSFSFSPKVRAAREELKSHPLYRALSMGSGAVLLVGAILLPRLLDKPTDVLRYAQIPLFLIIALSATVLTGWAGQLSLGQLGFSAIGAYMTVYYSHELPYLVSLALGVLLGVAAAIVIGIPALRIRGLYLAVVTLGFGLTMRNWFALGSRVSPGKDGAAQMEVSQSKGFKVLFWDVFKGNREGIYYAILTFALLALVLCWRLRRTGVGRSIIGVRDNEATAAAYTVSPTRAKLIAFCVSGGLAALAGGLLPLVSPSGQFKLVPDSFDVAESLQIVAIAVVGGISSITGAVLGTLLIVAVPTIFEGTQQVKLFTSGVGMMIVLLYFPGGLVSIVHAIRDNLLGYVAHRTGWTPPAKGQTGGVGSLSARPKDPTPAATDPLDVQHVNVAFGGRRAVDDVSIRVGAGEIVGLIGTNGAGKSTLMNAISGFVPATGAISLYGHDVTAMASHKRSRAGVGRAFQNAKLFGTLTARETLMVALEARERSLLVPSLLALPPSPMAERRKRKESEEIIHYLGLGRYADSLLGELSTGTRRIVELGCLIALDTKLMLLDEPTAGVAQRETEAFGPLIRAVKDEMGASILLIEHDMPMVMAISDRIYCLEAGAVIAEGSPQAVRENPAVIASYLGTDERAINRSGAAAP